MTIDTDAYAAEFPSLQFASPGDGILEIVIAAEGRLNAASESMHRDLALVWRETWTWTTRCASCSCAARASISRPAATSR